MKQKVLDVIKAIREEKQQRGKAFSFALHVELYRRLNHSEHRYSHLDISRAVLSLQDEGILRTGHTLNDVYYELVNKSYEED